LGKPQASSKRSLSSHRRLHPLRDYLPFLKRVLVCRSVLWPVVTGPTMLSIRYTLERPCIPITEIAVLVVGWDNEGDRPSAFTESRVSSNAFPSPLIVMSARSRLLQLHQLNRSPRYMYGFSQHLWFHSLHRQSFRRGCRRRL